MRLFRILTNNQETRQRIGRKICIVESQKVGEPLVLYYVDPVTGGPKAMVSSSPVGKVVNILLSPIIFMRNMDVYIFKTVLDLSRDKSIRDFLSCPDIPALVAVEIIHVLKSAENLVKTTCKITQILGHYKKEEK